MVLVYQKHFCIHPTNKIQHDLAKDLHVFGSRTHSFVADTTRDACRTELLRVCGLVTICAPQISVCTALSTGKSCACLTINISIQSCRSFNCTMFHIESTSRFLVHTRSRGPLDSVSESPFVSDPSLADSGENSRNAGVTSRICKHK